MTSTSQLAGVTDFRVGSVPTNPDHASRQAAGRVVGRRFGIVGECTPTSWSPGLPRVAVYAAQGPHHLRGWETGMPPQGTGVAVDADAAWLAAVAETIESYCSLAPANPRLLVRARFTDLDEPAVAPAALCHLSAEQQAQFPELPRLTASRPVDWCWAYSLMRGQAVRVPAGWVHAGCNRAPPNDVVAEQLSTGFACGVSVAGALLAGVCEILERDALTIAWHANLPFTPLETGRTNVEELLTGPLCERAVRYDVLRVPTDGPFPVVLAVAWCDTEPYATVGAACRPDPVAAARKALYETCQLRFRFRDHGGRRPTQVRTLDDHADLYAADGQAADVLRRQLHSADAPQALAEVPSQATGSLLGDVKAAIDALGRLGLEILVSDVTTADAAVAGYRVLRVLVPGCVDMAIDARLHPLGADRLSDAPERLGLRDAPLEPAEANLWPVPLA